MAMPAEGTSAETLLAGVSFLDAGGVKLEDLGEVDDKLLAEIWLHSSCTCCRVMRARSHACAFQYLSCFFARLCQGSAERIG